MSSEQFDGMIVGQGLAGSMLALELLKRGQKLCIIDNNHHKASSTVAAGIINPLTGPRLNLTEDFFQLFQHAKNFYLNFEKEHACSIFHPLKQKRWLNHKKNAGYYEKRRKDYPQLFHDQKQNDPHQQKPSTINIESSAVVDAKTFLGVIKKELKKQHLLISEYFDYDQLRLGLNSLEYKGLKSNYIIFCEGHQNIYNPFFKHALFQLSSGSILNLRISQLQEKIYNWGHWLCPDYHESGTFNLGASYHWDLDCTSKLDQDKHLFLKMLQHILNPQQTSVLNHSWGVRPSTKDRKPIIQRSNQQPKLFMFNGFGSKGCLSIPYYTQQFCNRLLPNDQLEPLVL